MKVDDDISPSLYGTNLTNTAAVVADNADRQSADFTTVPEIPVVLAASTDKSFDPDSAIATPGTKTTMNKIEADFDTNYFQPTGTVMVDLTTKVPAQSPTVGPDTVAWNTVAASARTDDGGIKGLAPKSEGNKVGAALATGPLSILKKVTGPAAEYAPTTFALTVKCTSVGEPVTLPNDGHITVTAGEPYGIADLPWARHAR